MAYLVKGFNKKGYEDYEYLAMITLDKAEAEATVKRLEAEQDYWAYIIEEYEVGRIFNERGELV